MKQRVSEFLVDLSSDLPSAVVEADTGEGLGVKVFSLSVPIESAIDEAGELAVTLPHGRLATGFDAPHGRLRVSFVRSEAE
ncbi:MAG: hypothetical protein KZQ99_10035 [Candidatus Thiodiazotropha sp. (ex Dulcina madagascariensis)]|nr:hypothetical protein [Candidatus Thiodiazotropha sp. (ex Dulcina madagascariensis)]